MQKAVYRKYSASGKFHITKGRGGAASWRGAIYYRTTSKNLARLNSIVVIFEYEVDEQGNSQAKGWEWK